jgi:plastocyanin
MNNKYLFTILAIVVVAIIALFIIKSNNSDNDLAGNTNITANVNMEDDQDNANTPAVNSNTNTGATMNTNTNTNIETDQPDGNDVSVFEVTYDGKAFAPSQLTIKNGDIVRFKNNSTGNFWPASAPHPAHTVYPEFDPKKAIAAGQTWEFKFTKSGTWSYHDHINPTAFGKITVQ